MSSFGSDSMMDQSSGPIQYFDGIPELRSVEMANNNLPPEVVLEPLNSIVPKYAWNSFIQYPKPILGKGSFATALKVFSCFVGTAVIKMPNQLQTGSWETLQQSSDEMKKRRREFVNCFLLNTHPNIVSLYGYIYTTHEEHPDGILMEFMAGGTVLDYVNNHLKAPQQFPLPEFMQNTWAKQIAMGLKFMHDRRIAHRDIKPNNILLTAGYRTAKIADFGLAKNLAEGPGNKHTQGIGFWQFTAPEMIMKNIYNLPVDCYSYGMVLYFIYYHRLPFEYDANMPDIPLCRALKGEGQPPLPQLLRPQLRALRTPIDELMERCWPVEPKERLTMHQIVHDHFYSKEGILKFLAYDV